MLCRIESEVKVDKEIIVTPEFNSKDPLHVALWIQAGRPSDQAWRPTITSYLQEDGSYLPPPTPAIITETPAYNPDNLDHYNRWVWAGKPDPAILDGDGKGWGPTIQTELIGGQYVQQIAPTPPENNVTDVEIMTPVFIDYRRQATLHMDGLKAQVWSYLKNEQEMDPALATAAGVAFCKSSTGIGVQYDDYIKAGGHPDAATDLWARIQEIKAGFAWFDAGVEAIFAAALGQEV